MRASEALTVKDPDINFNSNPTIIHIRVENTKPRTSRVVYISDKSSKELKRYMKKDPGPLFTLIDDSDPHYLYLILYDQFIKLLDRIQMNSRLEGHLRRKITFRNFRTFLKSQIAIQTNTDFSE